MSSKVGLIISREYLTRVKKKSFIILTLLAPVLIAGLFAVMVIVNLKNEKEITIAVIDDNEFFINIFNDSKKTRFVYPTENLEFVKKECREGKYDVVLHILQGEQAVHSNLYYFEEPPMSTTSNIERQMDKILFDKVLKDTFNINPDQFSHLKETAKSQLATIKMDKNGDEKASMTELNKIVGILCGFLIYLFVFMFASQVLRSVLEEKTNRIIEVLVSSVKPVQLLMGKVIGVALVGLTQFALWIALTLVLLLGIQVALPLYFKQDSAMLAMQQQSLPLDQNTIAMPNMNAINMDNPAGILQMIQELFPVSFGTLLLCFLFYFLIGYLLYSALFAAVGSAADNETESQQFILPVTIPLILTISLIFPISETPNGALAWWLSMIPFTSPVAMLIRIPSGVPLWELLCSMALLLGSFFLVIWGAAKIYRTGILMYGKKITYRELWKWLRY
ncbi:MAG: ABC transporter permease [Bacteroidales bacterium]|nr:ABC transporter permease [Bacteroidales bacterium]